MKIKTTKQIQKKHPCDETKWIAVDDLIKHIEDSRSPDGDYPDSDCIIRDLKILKKD